MRKDNRERNEASGDGDGAPPYQHARNEKRKHEVIQEEEENDDDDDDDDAEAKRSKPEVRQKETNPNHHHHCYYQHERSRSRRRRTRSSEDSLTLSSPGTLSGASLDGSVWSYILGDCKSPTSRDRLAGRGTRFWDETSGTESPIGEGLLPKDPAEDAEVDLPADALSRPSDTKTTTVSSAPQCKILRWAGDPHGRGLEAASTPQAQETPSFGKELPGLWVGGNDDGGGGGVVRKGGAYETGGRVGPRRNGGGGKRGSPEVRAAAASAASSKTLRKRNGGVFGRKESDGVRGVRVKRKITPVKRRLSSQQRKGAAPRPFHFTPPPTPPPAPSFGSLNVGQQFLCLLRKVPFVSDIIGDPRDPPPVSFLLDTPGAISDDKTRRRLDWTLASRRRGGREKRKLSDLYSDDSYDSDQDPDYRPPETLDTTDPLEYSEQDAVSENEIHDHEDTAFSNGPVPKSTIEVEVEVHQEDTLSPDPHHQTPETHEQGPNRPDLQLGPLVSAPERPDLLLPNDPDLGTGVDDLESAKNRDPVSSLQTGSTSEEKPSQVESGLNGQGLTPRGQEGARSREEGSVVKGERRKREGEDGSWIGGDDGGHICPEELIRQKQAQSDSVDAALRLHTELGRGILQDIIDDHVRFVGSALKDDLWAQS